LKLLFIMCLLATFCCTVTVQAAESTPESNLRPRLATDEVENQITMDREANPLYESRLLAPIHEWKNEVAESTGFNWSLDYSALFMSINSFGSYETMSAFFTHEQKTKGVAVGKGARNAATMMNKHNVFTIGGSDMFSVPLVERIKEDLTCNVRAGFTPTQALKHWTGNAGIVLKWSGPKDPYPTYKLGTISEGAYADLLLWDGNPPEDIEIILDESKLHLIMKDGLTYKNTLVGVDSPIYKPVQVPATRGQYSL
jgi:hypothetical protein